MVLEIGISNFFSISEEVVLDLRAANINSAKSKALHNNVFQFGELNVLKTAAIYGANASGKSNIINTIRFCHRMVFESHNFNQDAIFNYKPFKFGKYPKLPSSYFIRFVIKDIEYFYSFSLHNNEILTEELYYYPNGKKAKVFTRNEKEGKSKKEVYSFGTSVIKRPYDVAESTSKKTLFISRASQMDREIPKEVFNFFHQSFILDCHNYSNKHLKDLLKNYKPQLLEGLQLADSDILDFKFQTKKNKSRSVNIDLPFKAGSFDENETESLEIKTYHRSSPEIPFNFLTEESLGTRKLFFILLTIIDVLHHNKILLIDEIEDSLHSAIVEYILSIFNISESAQLIYSTHNTNLLDLDRIRKDQVWFVNKRADGSSDLYSLYDYSDFRDTMNLEKAYLQGRFDSVPIVNEPELSYLKKK